MPETELTILHGQVIAALDWLEVVHEDEYSISVEGIDFQLDCYLPDYHACIEADGPAHGLRGKPDKRRDELLKTIGVETMRLRARFIEAEKVDGLGASIRLWLLSISGDIEERRKKQRDQNALLS